VGTQFADQDERTIVITRVFSAPRELVFQAWTDPQHVAQWWGPHGFTNSACDLDLRVGGIFRLHMRGPDGLMYPCKGVFREIEPPARIVYDGLADDNLACGSGLPPNARVTVTFEEDGGETMLTIHTLLRSGPDREAAVATGFNIGWTESLDRLAAHLASS
jgi:uncharacterized protein YndB with AHSA1/START domain